MVTPQDSVIHSLKSQNYILNKQYLVKALLNRFHLNGNTMGWRPQTQFFQNFILNKQCEGKVLLKRIHLNGNTIGLRSQTQKLELYILNKQYHEKVLLRGFISMVAPQDFIHRLKSWYCILNRKDHVKVLLKRFHLNSHTRKSQSQNHLARLIIYIHSVSQLRALFICQS